MNKRGIQLAFGMIFSIIVIIAILATAFYVISFFLDLGRCSEISLYYREFQDEVSRAWSSEITQDTFSGKLPGDIEFVCLGDLTSPLNNIQYREQYDNLQIFRRQESNIFLYPREKSCTGAGHSFIRHLDFSDIDGFSCYINFRGKTNIDIEKGSFDSLVSVKR